MSSNEFFTVQPVATALSTLLQHITPLEGSEMLPITAALGRILAEAPQSPVDLPAFNRSAMDGYAVKAADTYGASESLPAYLSVVGHIAMGEAPALVVQPREAAEIHTGAMLPAGADAVVMVERTQQVSPDEIEILAAVAPGENVVLSGDDIRKGSTALPAGHRIRPQDIGGLLAVGIQAVQVVAKARVGILSSGDELVEVEQEPAPGQIRDINSYMLAALCVQVGADVLRLGIARDRLDDVLEKARAGLAQCDMLVMSAGSSVSARDLTYDVINQLGQPGVLQHGLAVKPGKPTIIAACEGKPVIGLPGNPVSAMLVARQIVIPTIRYLLKESAPPTAIIAATLTQNIASTTGREDSIPVRLIHSENGYLAEPVLGKSNLIYTLLQADGLIHIALNVGGYSAGSRVEVVLF